MKSSLTSKTASTAIGRASEQVGITIVSQTVNATKGVASSATIGAAGTSLSFGPVGVGLLVIQLGSMLIDIFSDPYYSYDNNALKDIKKKYEDSLRETLQEINISYPVKASPSMVSFNSEGELILDSETLKYFQEYLEKNGLYIKDENEDLAVIAKKIQTSRLFYITSGMDPSIFTQVSNITETSNYLYVAMTILLVRSIKDKQKNNEYKKQRLQFYTILILYVTIVYIFINQLLN